MANNKSREIDIIGVAKKILQNKISLAFFVLTFMIMGIIFALSTQKTYTAQVLLAPEITSSGGMAANLSDLASMVGVDLSSSGSSVDAIFPEIYPEVVASSDFVTKLFNIKVRLQKDNTQKTYFEHLVNDQKIPFWSYPQIWLSALISPSEEGGDNNKINTFQLTTTQYEICNLIKSNVTCLVDKKTSVITIRVKDTDPLVAATIADTVQSMLKEYITIYRTKKARNDLEYTQNLFNEAKERYVKSRQVYGSYADANEDLILQSYRSKQEELENEMQLMYNMYKQLSQQLQMAKAKVQEKTPVFTVIQSSSVPIRASSTPRSHIVLFFIFFGIIADVIWILYLKEPVLKYWNNRKK